MSYSGADNLTRTVQSTNTCARVGEQQNARPLKWSQGTKSSQHAFNILRNYFTRINCLVSLSSLPPQTTHIINMASNAKIVSTKLITILIYSTCTIKIGYVDQTDI
jgi:hypothetical protein